MKITFVYPSFERHADAHPELREAVSADEYLGPPSLGIASVAAATPPGHEIEFIDDRVTPFDPDHEADLFALSFFTPAATRGLEIADALRERGKKVVVGGIFPSMMPDVCEEHADAVVVGEGEAAWPEVLADAEAGKLEGRYQAPVDLSRLSPPRVDLYLDAEDPESCPDDYPLQLSRGCPLSCDACALPVQLGGNMRFHEPANVLDTVKKFAERNKRISLTEDTSVFALQGARRRLRAFLDEVIELQGTGVDVDISYLGISMPMILSLEAKLFEKLHGVGMNRFYLVGGFDPITRKAFGRADPAALDRARRCIDRCHKEEIEPYVSFLVGNPDDDESVFDRMLDFTREMGIELAEFAVATPYPGTPVWHRYEEEGRIFDHTWKHYNDANVVFTPHKMSAETLQDGYLYLWRAFYEGRAERLQARDEARRIVQY